MTKPERQTVLLWADLETTGLPDEPGVWCIEAAFRLTGPQGDRVAVLDELFPPLDTLVSLPHQVNPRSWPRPVLELHTGSGLMTELLLDLHGPPALQALERIVVNQLHQVADGLLVPPLIALAGAGVAHAEAVWLPRWFPKMMPFLGYWHLDVSTIRRFLKLWGFELPTATAVAHRAGPDVDQSIAMYRAFGEVMSRELGSGEFVAALGGHHDCTRDHQCAVNGQGPCNGFPRVASKFVAPYGDPA